MAERKRCRTHGEFTPCKECKWLHDNTCINGLFFDADCPKCGRGKPRPKAMNLYLLRLKNTVNFDVTCGVFVRAVDSRAARKLAATEAGDEGPEAWLNSKFTSCRSVTQAGKPGVLLTDSRNG